MASLEVDVNYGAVTIATDPVTVDINGLNDIQIAVTQPITTNSTLTLDVPDPITTNSTYTLLVPDPIQTESSLTFTIPEPIRTDSRAEIDLQPIAVDQCLRLSLGPLPATRICLPNRQHLGLTVFGVEVFGLTLEGEAKVLVGEPHRQAQVIGTGERHDQFDHRQFDHRQFDHRRFDHRDDPGSGGLRIRLGG